MSPFRIAVFASGKGSNFQALVDAQLSGALGGDICILVCDKPQAPVVELAAAANVDTFVFQPKEYASKEEYERNIAVELQQRGVELIVLAGYMRLLSPSFVEFYSGRIINIHPSLLPAFPGKDAIGQALAYGVKLTGVTVHFVDGGMDTGPVIAQKAVEIKEGDTAEVLAERIHHVEQRLYSEVVSWFAQRRISLNGRNVTIAE
ncbi:phosphoribosylglycinamide formyltransferase [Paenibacillus glucanolyticus]|jgi:phosphoribosylglycinamide formyltransferase-1|uniref:phosphoribosylglycinamide formyltransferase n=1 Tax=Paenibacillus TaxID=44249 RepID=UPI0003E23F82|nr:MULTISPECIES: phosphoribosylglycinamide formyltransferase [Paenibacillus]ANA80985.1 phosphoribosylglycinamide formyltransferase [Paenibacillus glucanolyticus]AVV54943.1 phosphoribosylglycinamide formyltransferase [Paenibacillus glucanolyticus]ETT36456.1 phosphoribosylglycinamide formyltransferase [Paenibacillus sp. FSL R5-808]OMF70920.1 phosphoribosylglycinamide formyltransferase [Paenibacillus glucanolyticus]